MKDLWRVCVTAVFLLLLWTRSSTLPEGWGTAVYAQTDDSKAETWLNAMTPEERVGQLFLVPFTGDSATRDSDIADLILNYKIGGVILLADNNNITGYGDLSQVPLQVTQLTNDLQRLALIGGTGRQTIGAEESGDPDAVPPPPTPGPPPPGPPHPNFPPPPGGCFAQK
jgi:hypothetical protein